MRLIAIALAAVTLSSCASVGKTDPATLALLKEIVTSTNCAHDDSAEAIIGAGGVAASFRAKVERHCPAQPVAQPSN